jgi:hypothetical protein
MPQSHQNWQYLGASGYTGAYVTTGGGGTPVSPRSNLDYLRLGVGRTPNAEYPDGYLATIRSRRDDRGTPTDTIMDSLRNRQNQRAYQRGVHRGERIDPAQYFLPPQLKADRGIKNQANGELNGTLIMVKRQAPRVSLAPAPHLVNDGKADSKAKQPIQMSPSAQQFKHLAPRWH